jgi:hypothetical protein
LAARFSAAVGLSSPQPASIAATKKTVVVRARPIVPMARLPNFVTNDAKR